MVCKMYREQGSRLAAYSSGCVKTIDEVDFLATLLSFRFSLVSAASIGMGPTMSQCGVSRLIVLQWNMIVRHQDTYLSISAFQLFKYLKWTLASLCMHSCPLSRLRITLVKSCPTDNYDCFHVHEALQSKHLLRS